MDNVKTDSYYIEKIRKDLEFIVEHMRNVDMEELNMFTAGRAHARLSAMPTGPVREVNSGTGLSLCLKARAWVPAVNI